MSIVVNLDVVMAQRKKGLTELAGDVDITLANLSILKNNISCLCFFKKTKCHNASPCICNYNYSIINQAVMIY